jgi:hypothetical protein
VKPTTFHTLTPTSSTFLNISLTFVLANNVSLNAASILADQQLMEGIDSAVTIFVRSVLEEPRNKRGLTAPRQRFLLATLNRNYISSVQDTGKFSRINIFARVWIAHP